MKLSVAKIAKAGLMLHLMAAGVLLGSASATAASVSEVAPDFEIATQNGNVLRLSEFRGRKPVYVVFWNIWCSYCVKKSPRYKKLQEQFGDKIEIIAINTTWSDSQEEMRSFEEHHHINYSTAFDTGEQITDRYQVFNVPTEFIVDVNGVIRYGTGCLSTWQRIFQTGYYRMCRQKTTISWSVPGDFPKGTSVRQRFKR